MTMKIRGSTQLLDKSIPLEKLSAELQERFLREQKRIDFVTTAGQTVLLHDDFVVGMAHYVYLNGSMLQLDEYSVAPGSITLAVPAQLDDQITVLHGAVNLPASGHQIAGEIRAFARATAPAGWLVCDGSAVSRSTYAELFAAVGTLYGAGDGSTTFTLPNLINRMARGGAVGQSGGADSVVLSVTQMPVHRHDVAIGVVSSATSATTDIPSAGVKLAGPFYDDPGSLVAVPVNAYSNATATGTLGGVTEASKGGTTPVPTLPAYTGVLYCIAAGGVA